MPLYGHELDETIDPFTAGLGFAVNLKDRDFLGSSELKKLAEAPLRKRVGLKLQGRRPAREGASLVDKDSRVVGKVTSGTFSPTLQCPIAMAYIESAMAVENTSIDVDIRGTAASAEIVPLPFYSRTN